MDERAHDGKRICASSQHLRASECKKLPCSNSAVLGIQRRSATAASSRFILRKKFHKFCRFKRHKYCTEMRYHRTVTLFDHFLIELSMICGRIYTAYPPASLLQCSPRPIKQEAFWSNQSKCRGDNDIVFYAIPPGHFNWIQFLNGQW